MGGVAVERQRIAGCKVVAVSVDLDYDCPLLHVQEGTVIVEVDGNRYDLAPGDALSFYGDAAHAYINSTDNSARFSLTVFEPDVGTAH